MQRRSVIVRCLAASLGGTIHQETRSAQAQVRSDAAPQEHLGVHQSVWIALLERIDDFLPDSRLALCAERFEAGGYRFQAPGETRPGNWRVQTEDAARARLSPRAVLLPSISLESRLAALAVLQVKAVSLAAGIGIYRCEGDAGSAALLMHSVGPPPRVLGIALNAPAQ